MLFRSKSSMQAHITCHLLQQNTQEILHQTKFYLDVRGSHIPRNSCSKFQQKWVAEQRDQKSGKLAARTRVSNRWVVFFGYEQVYESEGGKWRARGVPHLAQAWPGVARACPWCGGSMSPPVQLQVSLCHILCINILYNFSGIFRETL